MTTATAKNPTEANPLIEPYSSFLRVDARTERGGYSASLVGENETVRVTVGSVIIVEFKILRLVVLLDRRDGDWADLAWSASQAAEVLAPPAVLLEVLHRLCALHWTEGQHAGANALRDQFRDLMRNT